MMFRLILGLAVVVNGFMVICEAQKASSSSSATTRAESTSTLTSSHASSYSSSSSRSSSKKTQKKCPKEPKCPRYEEYSSRPSSIVRPLYCSEKDRPYRVPVTDETSKGGCVCKVDFLRADNGTCIPEDQCPVTCGPDEILDNCPMNCGTEYCPTSNEDIVCTMPMDEECPPPACLCGFNRRRALNGSCINTRDCPPFACPGPNEEYNPCPPLCPTDDCSQATPTGECPPLFGNILIILPCNPKCRCIEGYWRLNGTCVPYGQCPGVCPENERYSGCIQGECRALNCTQKGQPIACPRIDPTFCKEGCVCNEGFLRAGNGTCVPEDQCETDGCGENEEFSNCTQAICRAQDCIEKDWPIACPNILEESCIKACVCQTGFLRDDDGNCIPEDQCKPNLCQPNQEYSDCIEGVCRAQKCSEIGESIPCPDLTEEQCTAGCICKEGYLRSEYDYEDCIPEEQCETNACPPNEEFVPCILGVCRALNCTQRGQDVPCPDLIPGQECDGGCICKENFLRAQNGTCVPDDQCEPTLTCGENEILEECPASCTSDYCPTSADEEQLCVKPEPCQPACKCRFNYRKARNGTCIPTRDCPPFDCDKPNEEYTACPALCPTDDCSLPWVRKRCPFRIGIILECNPKCQCKDGYGRVDGCCIPFEDCPNLCPKNEKYSPCIQGECQPQQCADRDDEVSCPAVNKTECERGCVCETGFYRNETGQCISYEECGGPLCPNLNEHYTKTKVDCPPNTCEALVSKYDCGVQEEKPGCLCNDGYLRLTLDSPCIPICECPQMKDTADCQ